MDEHSASIAVIMPGALYGLIAPTDKAVTDFIDVERSKENETGFWLRRQRRA